MVRKIKAKLVLRLREEGFSGRQIAAQGMSRHSVTAVIEAAEPPRAQRTNISMAATPTARRQRIGFMVDPLFPIF